MCWHQPFVFIQSDTNARKHSTFVEYNIASILEQPINFSAASLILLAAPANHFVTSRLFIRLESTFA